MLYQFFIVIMLVSSSAFSANIGSDKDARSGSNPCKEIRSVCENAGYFKGGYKAGRGLFKNCLVPLSEGKVIPGVSVTQEKASKCAKHLTEKRLKNEQSQSK